MGHDPVHKLNLPGLITNPGFAGQTVTVHRPPDAANKQAQAVAAFEEALEERNELRLAIITSEMMLPQIDALIDAHRAALGGVKAMPVIEKPAPRQPVRVPTPMLWEQFLAARRALAADVAAAGVSLDNIRHLCNFDSDAHVRAILSGDVTTGAGRAAEPFTPPMTGGTVTSELQEEPRMVDGAAGSWGTIGHVTPAEALTADILGAAPPKPRTCYFNGHVFDIATGWPVNGIPVKVSWPAVYWGRSSYWAGYGEPAPETAVETITDTCGFFEVLNVPPTEITVTIGAGANVISVKEYIDVHVSGCSASYRYAAPVPPPAPPLNVQEEAPLQPPFTAVDYNIKPAQGANKTLDGAVNEDDDGSGL
jgi:hypothetical protein